MLAADAFHGISENAATRRSRKHISELLMLQPRHLFSGLLTSLASAPREASSLHGLLLNRLRGADAPTATDEGAREQDALLHVYATNQDNCKCVSMLGRTCS